jgi:hypothetical protein
MNPSASISRVAYAICVKCVGYHIGSYVIASWPDVSEGVGEQTMVKIHSRWTLLMNNVCWTIHV